MAKIAYVRVSTKEQDYTKQINKLNEIGMDMIYSEKKTGTNFDRTEWRSCRKALRSGDELYLTSLDRIGRTKVDILKELRKIADKGVLLRVLNIPTTLLKLDDSVNDFGNSIITAINNLLIEMYSILAEEELNFIATRRREGIEVMKKEAKGRTGKVKAIGRSGKATGRPALELTKEQDLSVSAWLNKDSDYKLSDCMKATGLSRSTLYRIKKERK